MAPRETENNAYAKFWGDKQRALWYVMVFSEVVNCEISLVVFTPNTTTNHAINYTNLKIKERLTA